VDCGQRPPPVSGRLPPPRGSHCAFASASFLPTSASLPRPYSGQRTRTGKELEFFAFLLPSLPKIGFYSTKVKKGSPPTAKNQLNPRLRDVAPPSLVCPFSPFSSASSFGHSFKRLFLVSMGLPSVDPFGEKRVLCPPPPLRDYFFEAE